jgi:hypothetical protein
MSFSFFLSFLNHDYKYIGLEKCSRCIPIAPTTAQQQQQHQQKENSEIIIFKRNEKTAPKQQNTVVY